MQLIMMIGALIYQQPIKLNSNDFAIPKPSIFSKSSATKLSAELENVKQFNEYIASLSNTHARLEKSNSN